MREELRAARAEARDFQRYRRVMAQTLGGVEAEVAAPRRRALGRQARSEGRGGASARSRPSWGQAAARAERHRLRTRRERRLRRRPQRWRRAAPTMTRRRRSAARRAAGGDRDDAREARRAARRGGRRLRRVEALRASLAARPPPPPAAAAAAEAAASEAAAAAAANADAAPVGNAGLERALALALSRNAELEGQLAAEAEREVPAGEMKPRLIASLEATARPSATSSPRSPTPHGVWRVRAVVHTSLT